MMILPWVFWLGLAIIFTVAELLTIALVSVWFAIGAIAAMIYSFFNASILAQTGVMILVSLVSIFLCYIFRRYIFVARGKSIFMNYRRVIGQTGVVTVTIDNLAGTGQIRVQGEVWSAQALGTARIQEGTRVRIESVQGVKAYVKVLES